MTVIAGTGHRCNKFADKATSKSGYDYTNTVYDYIRQELKKIIDELKPIKIISGGAIGFDTVLADMAIDCQIPLLMAVPFVGQEKIWPQKVQEHYHYLLNKAAEVVIVCEGGYAAYKMQVRNEYMSDRCDKLVACWDGTSGGTGNCVKYAEKIKRDIIRIDPRLAPGYHK